MSTDPLGTNRYLSSRRINDYICVLSYLSRHGYTSLRRISDATLVHHEEVAKMINKHRYKWRSNHTKSGRMDFLLRCRDSKSKKMRRIYLFTMQEGTFYQDGVCVDESEYNNFVSTGYRYGFRVLGSGKNITVLEDYHNRRYCTKV